VYITCITVTITLGIAGTPPTAALCSMAMFTLSVCQKTSRKSPAATVIM
jgi:hypothetical protein